MGQWVLISENPYYTGSGAVTAHGDGGNDTLIGTNQTSFQEFLYGDDGADDIQGGGGRDYLYGGSGNDRIDTGVDIPGTNGIASNVSGGDGADNIYSAGGISNLNGDAGDDIFHAAQGLWNGSEKYDGGADFDRIVADGSNQNIGVASISNVELISGQTFSNVSVQTKSVAAGASTFLNLTGVQLVNIVQIKGQGGNDFIVLEGGSGGSATLARNDVVNGGTGNDTIYSGFGNDTINGEAGDDTLLGGDGTDIITGGTGADKFWFTKVTDSTVGSLVADRISNFTSSQNDKIDLTSIDANTSLANDQAFSFIGTSAFSGMAGELRAETGADGFTHIYGDINADLTPDFEIILTNSATLSSADFLL